MAITIPNTFVAGTKIEVAPMNANFAEAANALDKRGNDTIAGNISVAAGVKIDGVDLSTIPNSSGTFDPLFAQVVIGTADTNGIRLDLETGTLAVREGDDSAYAPLISGLLTTSGNHVPASNDGGSLGISGTAWADLFLASGGVINFNNGDVTVTHSANTLAFGGASSGYTFDAVVGPSANGAAALGSATVSWANLFLASGGVLNFNNGDVTITHSTNTLAFTGASTGYTFSDGPVAVNAGLKFPATQYTSSDANTLDDYEEGTYTATLTPTTSGSITLNSSYDTLQYTKIGRMVHVSGHLKASSSSSPTGDTNLNLPFTVASLAEDAGGFSAAVTWSSSGSFSATPASARADGGATALTITGAFAAPFEMWFSFSYVA